MNNQVDNPFGVKSIAEQRWGLLFAVAATFTVALYTLWGRAAVQHMHPFVYMYLYTLFYLYIFRTLTYKVEKTCRRYRVENK